MAVTITKNFGPLAQIELSNRQLMREIGLLARELIVRRTLRGVDENERSFAPYSAGYRAQKAAELGAGPVNLQVSGAMLNAIQIVELEEDSVTLGFS